jgi:hypothetical protein
VTQYYGWRKEIPAISVATGTHTTDSAKSLDYTQFLPIDPLSSGCIVANSEVFLASADVRFFKQVTCPVWSKDKITQK